MSEMIQALKDSIKHWENLRDGKEHGVGSEFCALCALFLKEENTCVGCPVHSRTGEVSCVNTPYHNYVKFGCTSQNAQKEVDFLKDLLVEELERPSAVTTTEEPPPPKRTSVFHMGDIVTQKEKGMGIVKGFTGKDRMGSVGVEFFEWDHGHDISIGIQPCKAKCGHGWWCFDEELTLVYRPA